MLRQGAKIPPYGDPRRDSFLSVWWKEDPILAGALNTIIKRMRATGYVVEGGRNNAMQWARKIQNANDGEGWLSFIGKWVEDYLTTDLGAFIEKGLSASGRAEQIYNLDSLKCIPVPDPDHPFAFMQPSGKFVYLPRNNIIHASDMTSPRREHMNRGFCAVSRLIKAGETVLAIYDYELQKLGKLPPLGILTVSGVTMDQFADAWESYKATRKSEGLTVYTGLLHLGADDPSIQVSVDLTDLARLPDQFDRNVMLESWVKTIALNLGVDVGELWLIQHVGATKGSQAVQHQKALGKGTGEIHAIIEMALNTQILPADTLFTFDFQDDEQDRRAAEIMLTKVNTLIGLYTQSSRGPIGVGGVSAPFGRGGTGLVTDEGTPQSVGTTQDLTPPLINREQAIELGTKWGIFPPGFFGQEVATIAGMILKRAGLFLDDQEMVTVTHDGKVYRMDALRKRHHFKEVAKSLLSQLKDAGAEHMLDGVTVEALEYLTQ